jgi:hypothetical protein
VSDELPEIPLDRAVVDRIVDDRLALLLVGPTEDALHVPVEVLPEGAGEGTWLVLDLDRLIGGVDHQLTESRAADVHRRMERIRRQQRGGRFQRRGDAEG